MKQSLAYMAGIRLSASMSIFQHYSRNDILRLLEHIYALDSELSEAKKTAEEALEKLGAAGRELNEVKKFRDRLREENDELGEEISNIKRRRLVVLPKEVANEIEAFKREYHFAGSDTWMHKVLRGIFNESPSTINIRRMTGVKTLLVAFIHGYAIAEPIDHDQRLRVDIHQLVTTWDRTRPTSSLSTLRELSAAAICSAPGKSEPAGAMQGCSVRWRASIGAAVGVTQ